MSNPYRYHRLAHYRFVYDLLPNKTNLLLDYGSGDGYFAGKLNHKVKDIHGVDVDRDKVNNAVENYPKVKFKHFAVGNNLPYKSNFFNIVTMFHVLEHVDSEAKSLREISRVLKPGGRLFLASPYRGLFAWADTANLRFRFPVFHRLFFNLVLGKKEYKQRFNLAESKMYGDCSINRDWHKHYKEDEVRQLLGEDFIIEKFEKYSLFYPFALLLNNLRNYLLRPSDPQNSILATLDCSIKAREFSYNFLIVAKKLAK